MSHNRKNTPSWYEISTTLLRVEKLPQKKGLRWRLYTEAGIYLTEPDIQTNNLSIDKHDGPITLRLQGDRVVGWEI